MVMETGTKQTKGAPEQILNLCNTRAYLRKRDHLAIDKYALPGLRSLAVVAAQRIAKKTKKCSGGPWEFVGGLPLFDPPRHDSAYTIRRASYLGVVNLLLPKRLDVWDQTCIHSIKAIRGSLGNQVTFYNLLIPNSEI
ncbi:plasma membrane-type protein [Raphanus sativus]|nr:plasma membrane-type protein [Raphanus sativus]